MPNRQLLSWNLPTVSQAVALHRLRQAALRASFNYFVLPIILFLLDKSLGTPSKAGKLAEATAVKGLIAHWVQSIPSRPKSQSRSALRRGFLPASDRHMTSTTPTDFAGT